MTATTTCSYGPWALNVVGAGGDALLFPVENASTTAWGNLGPGGSAGGLYPASSTCVTVSDESGGMISTDPVLAVIMAGILLLLSAMYVRRVFFS